MDADALDAACQSIRPDMEGEAYRQAREVYGKRYDSGMMEQSLKDVAAMLGEQERQTSVREQLQHPERKPGEQTHYDEQDKTADIIAHQFPSF